MGLDLSDEFVILKVNSMAGHIPEPTEWRNQWGLVTFANWSGREGVIAEWHQMPADPHGSLETRFENLAAFGRLSDKQRWEHLDDGIFEVKAKGKGLKGHFRAGVFKDGKAWFITHFWKSRHKHKHTMHQCDIAKAVREKHRENRAKDGNNHA